MDNVLINIKTEIAGEDFPIEMAMSGNFEKLSEGFEVSYRESEITGMGRTLTTVKCNNDEVELERNGEFTAKLIFKENEIKIGYYETPYGEMDMMTDTQELRYGKAGDSYFLILVYTMEINGEKQGTTKMSMNIRTREQ